MKLTIGMATHSDFHGVYFTIQSLRLHHAREMAGAEIIVIDNSPQGEDGKAVEKLLGWVRGDVNVRYIPMGDVQGTSAPRDRIFREASGDVVVCMDCHVLLVPNALGSLMAYYEENPGTRDLLSGPMIYDDLRNRATHFADEWRGEMWGTWATDPRGDPFAKDYTGEPFEIPAMGLGFFSCRKEAWLGFNPEFRGFGGEEFYIHEKFRRSGAKCLCLPEVGWLHRFARPGGVKYQLQRWDKVRNYVIGHKEIGLPLDRVHEHFVSTGLFPQAHWDAILAGADNAPPPAPMTVKNQSKRKGCGSCGASGAGSNRPLPREGSSLDEIFSFIKSNPRDLDQHADFIREVAEGVGDVTAFVKRREWNGLLAAGKPNRLTVYQTEDDPLLAMVHTAVRLANDAGCGMEYTSHVGPGADSLIAEPIGATNLLVIDTIHHADRLWNELNRHGQQAERILLRGTGMFGERAEGGGPGLLLAVRRWVKEFPEWTVARHTRDQYGMTLLSRLPHDKKELPPLWKQAVNAARASWRAGTNVLSGFGTLVDTETQERRLGLCLLCPSHNGGRCAECGCPVDKKTSYPTESCPLGYWSDHVEAKESVS